MVRMALLKVSLISIIFGQPILGTHVTATVDETGLMRIYKNGELAGELAGGVVPVEKIRNHNYIGARDNSGNFFDGQLDDITISNIALDSSEVQSLYQDSLNNISLGSVVLPDGVNIGENSDILRGGFGNDAIDGGEGNDIIFGENELDNSSYIYAPYIEGALTYGHSSYLLTSPGLTWEQAQAEAESYGGNLVTINDAAEQQWLQTNFAGVKPWIGLTDNITEGDWQWVSGEALTYTNWAPNELNESASNDADYAMMNYQRSGMDYTPAWNDILLENPRNGIIEIDWSSAGGKRYYLRWCWKRRNLW